MNPVLEAGVAIGTLGAAFGLLVLLDRLAAAWHRAPASPAHDATPAEPAPGTAPGRPQQGPSAADRVPYDAGPLAVGGREEP